MDKIYDKYVIDSEATIPNKMTNPIPMRVVGEDKFDKNGYGESIYADDTRNDKGVADDSDSKDCMSDSDESQGGMY